MKWIALSLLVVSLVLPPAAPAPVDTKGDKEEIQKQLVNLLIKWYQDTEVEVTTPPSATDHHHHLRHHHHNTNNNNNKYENNYDDEGMQADAPDNGSGGSGAVVFQSTPKISSTDNSLNEQRDRSLDVDAYGRDKNQRINHIRTKIQQHTGRLNGTKAPGSAEFLKLLFNSSNVSIDSILGHAATSFPSCELPKNTDAEAWRDENVLNLYFPNDPTQETNATIATAILKLYRVFPEDESDPSKASLNEVACENSTPDDEKLIRISLFWYTKSLKRHRVKRRLCDSKVISENSKSVELNIMHALKAWTKGKNLGLAVVVEDQDQTVLKPSKYFKGTTCTVGDTAAAAAAAAATATTTTTATTAEVSATSGVPFERQQQEQQQLVPITTRRHFGRVGRDYATSAVYGGLSMLPVIRYCLYDGSSHERSGESASSGTACKVKKSGGVDATSRELHQKLQLVLQNANRTTRPRNSPVAFDPRDGIRDKQMVLSYQDLMKKLKELNGNNGASS